MIFWQHIKGYNQTTSGDALWSFIRFNQKTNSTYLNHFDNVPVIHINGSNDDSAATANCGHIITEKALKQCIAESFYFQDYIHVLGTKGITFNKNSVNDTTNYASINYTASQHEGSATGSLLIFGKHNSTDVANRIDIRFEGENLVFGCAANQKCYYYGGSTLRGVWWGGGLLLNAGLRLSDNAGDSSWPSGIGKGVLDCQKAIVHHECQAEYFNATSDRRAKTDIQPLLIDALNLIRGTQLYSFKYKETDTPSIGIIAQDVQNVNIQGFKLVDNEEATGKDLDYMTIHESKLTYILWKAVQEQQKLIEDLQNEIKELKKN